MKSNKLVIDTDKTNSLINSIKKSAVSMIDTIDSSKQSFSNINSSDKLSSGINTVSSNMSLIGEKMMSFGNNLTNNFDSFSEMEVLYSNMVDSITVPTELNKVDNIFAVKTNDVSLNKKDGEAIKTATSEEVIFKKEEKEKEENLSSILNETTDEATMKDIDNINYQKINNINNTEELDKKELNDYKNSETIVLDNITNETTDEATMKDIDNINYQKIDNINNTEELDKKELNDYKNSETIVLDNITNEKTEEKNLDDYNNVDEITLKKFNNNDVVQQDFKDKYNIENKQLFELNNNQDVLQDGDEYDIESR